MEFEKEVFDRFCTSLKVSCELVLLNRIVAFWKILGDEEPNNMGVDVLLCERSDNSALGLICAESAKSSGYSNEEIVKAMRGCVDQ